MLEKPDFHIFKVKRSLHIWKDQYKYILYVDLMYCEYYNATKNFAVLTIRNLVNGGDAIRKATEGSTVLCDF